MSVNYGFLQLFCPHCVGVFLHFYYSLSFSEPMIAPYLHVSEVDNTSITLRWSDFNYSTPISGYNVTVVDSAGVGNETEYSVEGDQRELSITNLVYLNTYNFSLLAVGDSGAVYTAPPITVTIRKYMQNVT